MLSQNPFPNNRHGKLSGPQICGHLVAYVRGKRDHALVSNSVLEVSRKTYIEYVAVMVAILNTYGLMAGNVSIKINFVHIHRHFFPLKWGTGQKRAWKSVSSARSGKGGSIKLKILLKYFSGCC